MASELKAKKWKSIWKRGPHPPREDLGPVGPDGKFCLLFSAGEMADDDRDTVEVYLQTKGYSYEDASGTRVVYPDDGNYNKFYDTIMDFAKRSGVTINRIVRCEDPGLGIIFPEDM